MTTLEVLQRVFHAVGQSGMSVCAIDSNFHWEEQFLLSLGSSSRSYLSFVVICQSFEPMEMFFSDERDPDADTMYALYMVCKKFACSLFLGSFSDLCWSSTERIPLAAEYRTIAMVRENGGWVHRGRRQLTSGEQMALDCLVADMFSRVHITMIQEKRVGEAGGSTSCMQSCTVEGDVLRQVALQAEQQQLDRARAEAFCMGMHVRLGQESMIRWHLDGDLARMICSSFLGVISNEAQQQ